MRSRCIIQPVDCHIAAGENSSVVRTLHVGEEFEIEHHIGGGDHAWLRVRLQDGTTGYVEFGPSIETMSEPHLRRPPPVAVADDWEQSGWYDMLVGGALFVAGVFVYYSLKTSGTWPRGYGREYMAIAYGAYRFFKGVVKSL